MVTSKTKSKRTTLRVLAFVGDKLASGATQSEIVSALRIDPVKCSRLISSLKAQGKLVKTLGTRYSRRIKKNQSVYVHVVYANWAKWTVLQVVLPSGKRVSVHEWLLRGDEGQK